MSAGKEIDEILNIDITVTSENLENDLFKVYSKIFSNIKKEDLQKDIMIEELKGGFINSIFKLSLKNNRNNCLIFRTFGMKFNSFEFVKSLVPENGDENNNTQIIEKNKSSQTVNDKIKMDEALFNRVAEAKLMNEISKHGLSEPVYAKYNNGIVYGYAPGVTVSGPLMLTNDFLQEITCKLAKFHSIKYEIPGNKFKTHFERASENFGPTFDTILLEMDKQTSLINEGPYTSLPNSKILIEDQKVIHEILTDLGFGAIVFCHNDLNQKNMIWNPQERKLSFIDFEMVMNNFNAMEIGYIFTCYPGHFLMDYNPSFFPNNDYRKLFITKYLKEFNSLNKINLTCEQFDNQVDELYVRTNLTSLLHLLRLILMGPFCDLNPSMFKNDELEKSREQDKYFCANFSLQVYNLYKELKEPFIKEAKNI